MRKNILETYTMYMAMVEKCGREDTDAYLSSVIGVDALRDVQRSFRTGVSGGKAMHKAKFELQRVHDGRLSPIEWELRHTQHSQQKTQVVNALYRAKVRTLEDLERMDMQTLQRVHSLGDKGIRLLLDSGLKMHPSVERHFRCNDSSAGEA